MPDPSVPASPSISHQQTKYQTGAGNPTRFIQDHGPGPIFSMPSSEQDMMNAYTDNVQLSKRSRLTSMGLDGNQQQKQQHVGPHHMDGFNGLDSQWKNTSLQQQHSLARGMQYANTGSQKCPQQVFEGAVNQESGSMGFNGEGQQGLPFGLEAEPVEIDKLGKNELGGIKMIRK